MKIRRSHQIDLTMRFQLSTMPHYLRMLSYAKEPDDQWGPARDTDRFGRYSPRASESNFRSRF
jgi:hypothetical protein